MGIISVSLPSDGSAASVSQYNTPITTITNVINGNLDSNNIASLSGTKLTAGTVPGSALDVNAAGGWTSVGQTLTYGSNNGNKEFTVTAAADLTGFISPGYKLRANRGTIPPTQCMSFTSVSSQYATKSSPTGISFSSAFTCEDYVYLNSYTGQVQFLIGRTDNSTGGFGLEIDATGRVRIFYGASSSFTDFISFQSIPLNTWVHVAGVVTSVSSKTGVIYINGMAIPSFSNLTAATTLTQTSNLSVGAAGAGVSNTFLNGQFSEGRIWSVAQSQSSIQTNMGVNLVGTESNLVGLFQGGGNFNDATTNANNLTATNSAIATQASNPFNAIEYAFVTKINYSNPTTTITLKSIGGTIPNQTLNTAYYSVVDIPFGWPNVSGTLYGHRLLELPFLTQQITTNTSPGAFGGSTSSIYWSFTVPSNCGKIKIKIFNTSVSITSSGVAVITLQNGSTQVAQINQTNANGQLSSELLIPVVSGSTFNFNIGWSVTAGTGTWSASTGIEESGFMVEVS